MTDGLLDEWMTGVEFKGNLKWMSCIPEIQKGISHFLTGLFYSYVSDTQSTGNPIIQSSNHPIIQSSNHPIIQSSNHPIIHGTVVE
jgi:hypothetical protein